MDYSKYSLTELYEARRTIDENGWPDRAEALDSEIESRSSKVAEVEREAEPLHLSETQARRARLIVRWWLLVSAVATIGLNYYYFFFPLKPGLTLLPLGSILGVLLALGSGFAAWLVWQNRPSAQTAALLVLVPQLPMVLSQSFVYWCSLPARLGLSLMLFTDDLDLGIQFDAGLGAAVQLQGQTTPGWWLIGLNFLPAIPLVLLCLSEPWARQQRLRARVQPWAPLRTVCTIATSLLVVAVLGAWQLTKAIELRMKSAQTYIDEVVVGRILQTWDADLLLNSMGGEQATSSEKEIRAVFDRNAEVGLSVVSADLEGSVSVRLLTSPTLPDAEFEGLVAFGSGQQAKTSLSLRYLGNDQWEIVQLLLRPIEDSR